MVFFGSDLRARFNDTGIEQNCRRDDASANGSSLGCDGLDAGLLKLLGGHYMLSLLFVLYFLFLLFILLLLLLRISSLNFALAIR